MVLYENEKDPILNNVYSGLTFITLTNPIQQLCINRTFDAFS